MQLITDLSMTLLEQNSEECFFSYADCLGQALLIG